MFISTKSDCLLIYTRCWFVGNVLLRQFYIDYAQECFQEPIFRFTYNIRVFQQIFNVAQTSVSILPCVLILRPFLDFALLSLIPAGPFFDRTCYRVTEKVHR